MRGRVASILATRREVLDRALSQLAPREQSTLELLLERMLTGMTSDRETYDHTCRLFDLDNCPPGPAARHCELGQTLRVYAGSQ